MKTMLNMNDQVDRDEMLARLQNILGDDLTWDNVEEKTSQIMNHLRAQVPLFRQAEKTIAAQRDKIGELESEKKKLKGESGLDIEQRLKRLESDLSLFRTMGRWGTKLLGLDK